MSKPYNGRGGRGGAGAGARKPAAQQAKKLIFNAGQVAVRLEALREAVVEKLYQDELEAGRAAAAAAGQAFDEATVEVAEQAVGASRWWAPALKFDWAATRKGNNGTQWVSDEYRDEAGVAGPLVVRINGEKHTGRIMPSTDEGVAELATQVKNPNVQIKKRDKKPSVQIQQWAAQVKTAEDGITILTDDEGRPIYPDDSTRSAYYRVAVCVNEAFVCEARTRIQRGLDLVATARGEKLTKKAAATAQGALDAFVKTSGPRFAGDMILAAETVAELRKQFPNPKDLDLLVRGAITTSNTKIANLVQEIISDRAAKNAGMPLPNPMTRIAMNFDQATGMSQMAFFDKDKPFDVNGSTKYDVGKVDDEPINAENVHKFVMSRSTLDGIVNMDSVCFSNMGISMPVKADVLVVAKPTERITSLDDVYDDGYGYGYDGSSAEAGASAGAEPDPEEPQPSAPAPAPAPAPASAPAKPASAPAKSASAKAAPAKAPITKSVVKAEAPPSGDADYSDLLKGLGAQQ